MKENGNEMQCMEMALFDLQLVQCTRFVSFQSSNFRKHNDALVQGAFDNNMFHGEGTYRWPDGSTYSGGWQFNRMHGEGTYTNKDGVRWTGAFYDGKFFNGRAYISVR